MNKYTELISKDLTKQLAEFPINLEQLANRVTVFDLSADHYEFGAIKRATI